MTNVSVLVGAQWGDEGKGKWIDILAENADVVARYQGGNNAGHTLYIEGKKVVLHQIPSGIFRGKKCALTAGVVVNPAELDKEMEKVKAMGVNLDGQLWLSERSHVISPWHIYTDGLRESNSDKPIGTTKRGIGPTYADKANRTGLRLGDYIDDKMRLAWVERMKQLNPAFQECLVSHADQWESFHRAASDIAPFVVDAEDLVRQSIAEGHELLMEGAQGALLDIDHGTYPYVTSSSTASGGAFASLGFSPRVVNQVLGVAKAYLTRVGEGPFPTELDCDDGKKLAEKGHEFGATTGRPRRCGWLDLVALKYSADINGFDGIVLNKMDILSGFKTIKLAVAYEHPKLGRLEKFPSRHEILKDCTPIYETHEGWDEEIPNSGKIDDLPPKALKYVKAIEKFMGIPITHIGTGVNRQDALFK